MKIYTSNYRDHWISPYTVLEKVLWWKDWEHVDAYDKPWVNTWVDRLSPVCKTVQKLLDIFHPRIRYVKIDHYDTWNMDGNLAIIILPMLVQLKQAKHGSPFVADEDVPANLGLRSTEAQPKTNDYDIDDNHHLRWDWVLSEMIWAFTQLQPDNDWEALYTSGKLETIWEKSVDGETYEMKRGPNDTYKIDRDGMKIHQERIDRGLKLFGTYFQALWD
jgi:hypothetical protein